MSTTPLSIDEFAQRIKDKHPVYAQMDNTDLAARVLKKYPEYTQAVTQAPQAPFPKGQGMDTGEGPIAQGLTSFETQLSSLPRNLWQGSFFGELGNPQVRAAHEQRQEQEKQAMAQPGLLPGAKYAGSLINPVQKVDAGTPAERIDVGATGANLLPYTVAARSALNDVPIGRVAKATGAGIKGGVLATPVLGRIARGAIRGATKSWEASAPPDVEIPPSKVSSTPPETPGKVSLNRLTSDIQSLGYSKADALARAKAGISKYPDDLNAATTEAMRTNRVQAQAAPTTAPPSKPAQVAQARAAQRSPQHTPTPTPAPKTVYHGTTSADLPAIRQQGLTPLSSRDPYAQGGQADLVMTTDKPEVAQQYAEMRAQKNGSKPVVLTSTTSAFPEPGPHPGEFVSRNPVPPKSLNFPESQAAPTATQYEVAPPSRPLYSEGKPVPADTDLTPALQKSIPTSRIQGKIMQVVRREGTLGMDRLMEAPELQGLSRDQVEAAAMQLGNSKKLWVPTKEADAHGPAGIISLAIRKP